MKNMSASAFRRYFRRGADGKRRFERYAWPGGYPMYLVMADGGAICPDCVDAEKGRIHAAIFDARAGYDSGWVPAGVEVNWEDNEMACANCYARIESAYGDDGDMDDAAK